MKFKVFGNTKTDLMAIQVSDCKYTIRQAVAMAHFEPALYAFADNFVMQVVGELLPKDCLELAPVPESQPVTRHD